METSDKSSMGEYKPKDREMSLNVENRMVMGKSNNRTAGTTTEMEDRHLMNKRRVLPEDAPSLPDRIDVESTTEFDMEDDEDEEDEDEEDIEELK